MKYIKTVLLLMLASVLLCGCGTELKQEDITGKWVGIGTNKQAVATKLLDQISLYTEERDFVDLNSLQYIKCVKFTKDGKYTFSWPAEENKPCVRDFYEGIMDALYRNRVNLNELYGTSFDDMTRDEFNQFYADMYGFADYESMINSFVENAYDYEQMAVTKEKGTYKIDGPVLVCTVEGSEEGVVLGCEVAGDTLKLIYAGSEEVYTRTD